MILKNNLLAYIVFTIAIAIILNLIKKASFKRYWIFISSIAFYLLCDYKYLLLLFIAIIWSYFCGKRINKFTLSLGIIPLILTLVYFKWGNYLPISLINTESIIMPLGLSYFSFKIISYLADIYCNRAIIENNFIDYFNYVAFFPQMLCGPISRISELSSQLKKLTKATINQIILGIYLILSGLFKKAVVADRISSYVDTIFLSPDAYPGLALWTAAFLYTIQIYCDFAGYSEIVIGLCSLMGIDVSPNFKLPYLSYSMADFWKRWHISLSSWLKDYIYIPLGGNRKGKLRKLINVFVTFLISGLWHGNTLNFLIWGLWHGGWNLIPIKPSNQKFIRFFQSLLTFFVVMLGWVIFNANSIVDGFHFFKMMFTNVNISVDTIIASLMPFTNDYSCLSYAIVVAILILILLITELHDYKRPLLNKNNITNANSAYIYPRFCIFMFLIILFGTFGQNSFIYANF